MTGDELKAAAVKLFGEHGAVTRLAEKLKMERTQVWRYIAGRAPVPGPVEAAVTCWLEREACRVLDDRAHLEGRSTTIGGTDGAE